MFHALNESGSCNVTGDRPSLAFVGETITFRADNALTPVEVTKLSAPAGSTAAVDGQTFAPDRPGRFVFSLSGGGAATACALIVMHPAAKDDARIAAMPAQARRNVLQGLAVFGNVDWTTTTTETPLPHGLDLTPYGAR